MTDGSMPRSWVRLPSGRHLDLISPTPLDWEDSDLALRLARTYRWSGESRWPLPLSVAQHALTVLWLRRSWSKTPLSPMEELRELHHDSEEGLLGFDCSTPLKPILGEAFEAVVQRLQQAVFIRYGITPWSQSEKIEHKKADRVAAASEAAHVVGWPMDEVRSVLKIRDKVLESDPLVDIYGGQAWEPWPTQLAAERFLGELQRIEERRRLESVSGHAIPVGPAQRELFPS